MSEEHDKIQKLLKEHEDFAAGKLDNKDTPGKVIRDFLLATIIGFVVIFLASFTFWLITRNPIEGILFTAGFVFTAIGVIWIGLSFSAGAASFQGEMARRAWTNTSRKINAMQDFKNLWEWGSIAYGFVFAGIPILFYFYFQIS